MSNSVHATARLCKAAVDRALAHLTTARGMSCWNLGLWNCREHEDGLFTGKSLFDGSEGWVRIRRVEGIAAADYHAGSSPDRLVPGIHARVIDAELLGHGRGTCVVTLLAWRPEGMTDDRWNRLVATHETEIGLIQAQLNAQENAQVRQ